MDGLIGVCKDCLWWKYAEELSRRVGAPYRYGYCRRMPRTEKNEQHHWCGEFEKRK